MCLAAWGLVSAFLSESVRNLAFNTILYFPALSENTLRKFATIAEMMWFHDLFPILITFFSFVCFVHPPSIDSQSLLLDNFPPLCTLSIPHALSLSLTCPSSLSASPNIAWSLVVSNRRESVGIGESTLSLPSPASPLFDLLLQSGKRASEALATLTYFECFLSACWQPVMLLWVK